MVVVESRIEHRADLPGLVAEVAGVAASLDASDLGLRFVVLDAQAATGLVAVVLEDA